MPQQQSPFLEGKYGWNYGENGWSGGMDENLLKFSFMFDGNVDSIVAALPPVSNGAAHFNSTDNRFYFGVGGVWYSSPCPKSFIFKIKSNGDFYQFNGTSAVKIDSPSEIDSRLDAVELTVASLGTAAFEDVSAFATQAELDVVEGQAQGYTDALRGDLADSSDPAKGAGMVGYRGRTAKLRLDDHILITDHGAAGDGITDDWPAMIAASSRSAGSKVELTGNKTYRFAGYRPRIMDNTARLVLEPNASIKMDINPGIKEFPLYSPAWLKNTADVGRVFEQNRDVPLSPIQTAVAAAFLKTDQQYAALNLATDFSQQNVTGLNTYSAGSATVDAELATWASEIASGQEGFWRTPVVGEHVELTMVHLSSVAQGGFVSVDIVGDVARYSVTLNEAALAATVYDHTGATITTFTLPQSNYGFKTNGSVCLAYRVISTTRVEVYVNDWLICSLNVLSPFGGTASNSITRIGFTVSRQLTDVVAVKNPFSWSSWKPRSSRAQVDGVIGDSISYGAFASKDWPFHLKNILAQAPGGGEITITNHAVPSASTSTWVNGGTYTGLGNTINYSLAALDFTNYRYVYVMLGTNDCQEGVSTATYRSNLITIANHIKSFGASPIFGIPPVWQPGVGSKSENLQTYIATLRKFCADGGYVTAEVRNWFGANSARYFDGIHPHEVGQVAIAAAFAEARIKAEQLTLRDTGSFNYDPQPPTYANGWQAYGSATYQDVRFKREGKRVILYGLMKSGTVGVGTVAFYLPAGLRPPKALMFPVLTSNGSSAVAGQVTVGSDGSVSVWYGSNTYVSLTGVEFDAA